MDKLLCEGIVMKNLLLAAAAVMAVAAPAMAQTADSSPFTGPRIELHGGWDWMRARAHTSDGVTDTRATNHINDGFVGGQIGYDYAVRGSTVVGVFGSYDLSNNEECGTVGTTTDCFKVNRNIEAGARVGQIFGGQNLVYLKGAYVNGRFGANSSDSATGAYLSDHEKRDGWRAGVGVERALGRHAYVKAEYNYSRYNRFNGELGPEDVSVRLTRQEALGGLGIRF
jgi:outer membrane immunogenic protein